jgi:pSer/pThr/pTyr-binding forkhead associated (FHA) protein
MASIAHPNQPLLRLLVQGGGAGPTYEIRNESRIGRTEGTITFPHDQLMSSNHARVFRSGAEYFLIDEASSNGTFIKVKKETKLEPGDVILVGGQLFRFEA